MNKLYVILITFVATFMLIGCSSKENSNNKTPKIIGKIVALKIEGIDNNSKNSEFEVWRKRKSKN